MVLDKIVTTLIDYSEHLFGNEIIIFGSGKGAKLTLFALKQLGFNTIRIVDNEKSKWGNSLFEHIIENANILQDKKNSNIKILIASDFYNDISKQLNEWNYIEMSDYFPSLDRIENINEKVKSKEKEKEKMMMEEQIVKQKKIINGVEIGKYTYGYKKFCYQGTVVESIGSFTSINHTAEISNVNHPVDLITTHPFLYYKKNQFNGIEKVPGFLEDTSVLEREKISNNGKVVIGNDVWIGAGAIVTKDVPDYAIVIGVPARVLRFRFSTEKINILNELKWWDWEDDVIKEKAEFFQHNNKFFEEFGKIIKG